MNTPSPSRTPSWRFTFASAAAFLALAAALLLPQTSTAAPLAGPMGSNDGGTPVGAGWLNQMRQAGLRGDRSQLPRMVEIFQNPPGAEFADVAYQDRLSLLRPLAQLGATEALPALEEVIQSDPTKPFPGQPYADLWENEQVIAAAKAVKARILAQSATQGMTDDKARAAALVKQFFQELGQTPETLNAAVTAYQLKDRQHLEAAKHNPEYRHDSAPVALFAVRELADMAYRDRYKGLTSLPGVARVDFAQDAGAALKVRLAPLSRGQRVATLVEEISRKEMGDNDDLRRAQLLADEGPSALPMIAAKLQDFKAHREHYRGKFGTFGGLSILSRAQENLAADAAAKPQVSSATADANLMRSGWPRQIAPGY